MRANRREINIFNMSLLDILCGALGAFCFMMLVALPYYKPPGEEKKLREAQAETNRLLNEIEKMKDHMTDKQAVEDLTELVRKLEAQIKLLQGEVNRLSAENRELRGQVQQLKAENQQLQAENQQLKAEIQPLRSENQQLRAQNQQLRAENQQLQAEKKQLEAQNNQLRAEKKQLQDENTKLRSQLAQKKPFVVITSASGSPTRNVSIFLSDNILTEDKQKSPNGEFDPRANQTSGWADDRVGSLPGQGIAFWVTSSVVPKESYKVYLKDNQPSWFSRQPLTFATTLYGDLTENRTFLSLPDVTLVRDHSWVFLGTITVDENLKLSFRLATLEERELEWKAHSTPAPTPSPTPGPTFGPPLPETSPTPPMNRGPVGRTPEERAFFDAMRHVRELMARPNTEPGIEEKRQAAIKEMQEARKKMQEARSGQQFPFGPPLPSPSPR
jgi:cell division protein FtsB